MLNFQFCGDAESVGDLRVKEGNKAFLVKLKALSAVPRVGVVTIRNRKIDITTDDRFRISDERLGVDGTTTFEYTSTSYPILTTQVKILLGFLRLPYTGFLGEIGRRGSSTAGSLI